MKRPDFSPNDRGDTLTLKRCGLPDWVGYITSNICEYLLSFLYSIRIFLSAGALIRALDVIFVIMPLHNSDNNNNNAAIDFKSFLCPLSL